MNGSREPADRATVSAWIDRLPAGSPPHGSAGAAVLIVLRQGRNDVETLLIERAVREGDPASGQVGLPGGRTDDSDGPLVRTALRELEEEVGLSEGDLAGAPRFVGFRDAPVFGLRVGIFAAGLAESGRPPSASNVREVAHVFWVTRRMLETYRHVPQDGVVGGREIEAVLVDGHVLWGFTRRALLDFFGILPVRTA